MLLSSPRKESRTGSAALIFALVASLFFNAVMVLGGQFQVSKDTNNIVAPVRECPVCPAASEVRSVQAVNQKPCENDLSMKTITAREVQREGLKKALHTASLEILTTKFGPGPHRVKFGIDTSQITGIGEPPGNGFILRMAPANLVPHAILYFLTQVASGKWVGGGFIRNAGHVLQADPLGNHDAMRNLTVPYSVAYQDFSPMYPHREMTVGLAGRPGGPDWYISLVDNTANHGPGGQRSYDLPEEADACFGQVETGQDVVRWLHKIPAKKDSFQGLHKPVIFTTAEILR